MLPHGVQSTVAPVGGEEEEKRELLLSCTALSEAWLLELIVRKFASGGTVKS